MYVLLECRATVVLMLSIATEEMSSYAVHNICDLLNPKS